MIGYRIRKRMGTTLFWEITVFAKLSFFGGITVLTNYRFWQIIHFLYIYTAEDLLEAIIILAPQLKWSYSHSRANVHHPILRNYRFLENYRFCEITVFDKLPFLTNCRFFCTFILQKSLLKAVIILAPQLKWSDTPFESERAPPYFEKLPFLQNYRFCKINVFAKLPFLTNYSFWQIVDFLFVHLYSRRACWRQLLF